MARLLTRKSGGIFCAFSDVKNNVCSNNISHFIGRGYEKQLLKVKYKSVPNRRYIGIAARVIRGVLKIRYLVLGGAVGGGVTLNKKYAEWRDGLPDMGWLNEVLPDSEKFNRFTRSLVEVKDNIRNSIDADNAGGRILKELSEMQLQLTKRLENAKLAANFGKKNFDDYDEEDVVPSKSLQIRTERQIMNSFRSMLPLEDRDLRSLPDDIRAELITLKSKYRRRLLQIKRNVNSKMSLLYQDIQSELKKRPKVTNLTKKMTASEEIELPQIQAPMLVLLSSRDSDSSAILAALLGVDLFSRLRDPEVTPKSDTTLDDSTEENNESGDRLSRRAIEIELLEGADLTATISSDGEEKHYDLTSDRQLLLCQRHLAAVAEQTDNLSPLLVRVRGGYQQPLVVVLTPPLNRHVDRLLAEQYSRKPHSLLLHLQNCDVECDNDATVKDLVKSCDPDHKRTVLTINGCHNLSNNKNSLDQLNSLLDDDYLDTFFLAIDSSKVHNAKDMLKDEEAFFNSSSLVGNGTIKVTKSTFPSLRYQILDRCQKIFLKNIEQQAKELSIISEQQELTWRRTFGTKVRPLDSEEVLNRAFDQVLDNIANLKRVKLSEEGWCRIAESYLVDDIVDAVMEKIVNVGKGSVGLGESSLYGSVGTRTLRSWIDSKSGYSAVSRAAHFALQHQLKVKPKSPNNQGPLAPLISETAAKISEVILLSHQFETTEKESEAVSILSHDIIEESEILEENDWNKSVTLLEKSFLRHQKTAIDKNETSFLKHALDRLKSCKTGFGKHQLKDHNEVELDCPEVILFYKIQQIALVMSRSLRQQMLERHAEKVEKVARGAVTNLLPQPSSNPCLQMAEDIKHVRRLLQLLENLKKSLKPED